MSFITVTVNGRCYYFNLTDCKIPVVRFIRFDLKYVQIVNSPGTYGEETAAEMVRHARQSGICVAQTITLPSRDLTRESADRVVQVIVYRN